jgi:hypothetical protein
MDVLGPGGEASNTPILRAHGTQRVHSRVRCEATTIGSDLSNARVNKTLHAGLSIGCHQTI